MLLIIIFSIFIVLSLGGILFIIITKFPQLSVVDLDNLPEEKITLLKDKIIENRFRRKIKSALDKVDLGRTKGVLIKTTQKAKQGFGRLVELEKNYAREIRTNKSKKNKSKDPKEGRILLAKKELTRGNLVKAEEILIDVVSLDSKCIEAYLGLAGIYLEQDEFSQALETAGYVLKLDEKNIEAYNILLEVYKQSKENELLLDTYQKMVEVGIKSPGIFYDLAKTLEQLGKPDKALEQALKSVELAPKDPKYLDYLLNLSIINRKKFLSLQTLDQLKTADPDNQRLEEIKKQIADI